MINRIQADLARDAPISRDWHLALLVFLLIFSIYLVTTPATVVLEDDGIFVLAAYFNGIAHSPGYPLFTFLGHLATYVPLGSVAFRVHALSALFGAASCVLLYFIARILLKDKIFAVAAALCLGVSKTFWSQSIIAEVYTLNTLIYLVLLYGTLVCAYRREASALKLQCLMFFVYGLGLSNHWPLIILSTPSLLAILWPRISEILRNTLKSTPFLFLGLLPYVWMVLRSRMDPVISFFGPLESWYDIWYMISRKGYSGVDTSLTADYLDKLQFGGYALVETAIQLGPLGGSLAIIGFIAQWKYWQKNICVGLLLGYLGSTLVLAGLLSFDYMPLYKDIYKVYPLISYAIAILWIVLGVKVIADFIKNRFRIDASHRVVYAVFSLSIVLMGLIANLPYNYRRNDLLGQNYALTILNGLDQDAVFFTSGDIDTGTLGYYNLIENTRTDVTLINVRGLVFNTRLEKAIGVDSESSMRTLAEFIEGQDRPIYFVSGLPEAYGTHEYGLYRMLDRELEQGTNIVALKPEIRDLSEGLLSLDTLYDSWEMMIHKLLIADYCQISTHLFFFEDPQGNADELFRVCRGYYGLIAAASVLLTAKEPNLEILSILIERAGELRHEAKDAEDFSRFSMIRGAYLEARGDNEGALELFRRAMREWPNRRNPAVQRIEGLLLEQEQADPGIKAAGE